MSLVSIIVPVYNVEPYIETCIQSLIRQTMGNIEVILVDDGSTDRSGELCDQYAEADERIRVIHKQNGGLSSARNADWHEEDLLFSGHDVFIKVCSLRKDGTRAGIRIRQMVVLTIRKSNCAAEETNKNICIACRAGHPCRECSTASADHSICM